MAHKKMNFFFIIIKKAGVLLIFISCIIPVFSQYSMGTTGLLNTPNANMQKDGMFIIGTNYIPKDIMPDYWDYNTGNYFLNITFFPFIEIAYRCTFLKVNNNNEINWNQDRSVSLRLRAIKESRFMPSIVVGSNDLLTTRELNVFEKSKGNRFFSSIYAVATKNIYINRNKLSITSGSYILSKNELYKGVFGGIEYSPSFLRQVSIIAEYDSNCINTGLTVLLFRHLSLHAFSYDFKAISFGLRYEFCLLN